VSDTATDSYLDNLLRGQSSLPASPRGWLNALRADALERANALSLPTTRDEEWRYTDLSPLYQTGFLPTPEGALPSVEALAAYALPEPGCRLVFVDGHFAPKLSSVCSDPALSVASFSQALAAQDPALQANLARHVPPGDEPFVAVNTAWLQDGVLVRVHAGKAASAPVHVLCVSTRADAAGYPRLLVVAEANSDCTVVEDFVALHGEAYLTNAVTEVALADGARVRHARVQRESAAAFHIGTCGVRIARGAHYLSSAVALGARISRFNLNIVQAGEGAESTLDGLALIAGKQLADTHSLLDHRHPHGRSRQLFKSIVDDSAHAVFNGKIFVHQGAQRTDSSQQSRSLLLSPRARVDTKPQLEIFADDVKCAHGAAVGQLEAEQVFYLKSRGLDEAGARNLLTFAFAAEIVRRIPLPSLAAQLERIVLQQTQKQTTNRNRP